MSSRYNRNRFKTGLKRHLFLVRTVTFLLTRFQIVSKNPIELAIELCLASVHDDGIRQYYLSNLMPLCDDEELIFNRPTIDRKSKKEAKRKNKNRNKKNKKKRKNRKKYMRTEY